MNINLNDLIYKYIMIAALLLGRKGSVGFAGKNLHKVLGRPLMFYPLDAALKTKSIDEVYVSTDDERIMEIGRKHGAKIIVRPPELCTSEALGEDAYVHGYNLIKKEAEKKGEKIELMVLLFCNAPMINPELLEEGIAALRKNPQYDSAITVSKYNMWSPLRARRIERDGLLHPFVPHEAIGDVSKLNCDRDSQGDVWFADVCASIVRPRCLENIHDGMLPQKWMGKKIYPIKRWGGLDVDYEWQIPQVEYWLKKNGFKEEKES